MISNGCHARDWGLTCIPLHHRSKQGLTATSLVFILQSKNSAIISWERICLQDCSSRVAALSS